MTTSNHYEQNSGQSVNTPQGPRHSPPSDLAAHKARTRFLLTPATPPPEYESDEPDDTPPEGEHTETTLAFVNLQGATFPAVPRTLTPSPALRAHLRSSAARYAVVRDSLA